MIRSAGTSSSSCCAPRNGRSFCRPSPAGGGALGFLVAWRGRRRPKRDMRWLAIVHIELMQATPVLMVLFLVFYGLGLFGFDIPRSSPFRSRSSSHCGFRGDIWRGCIEGDPEAAMGSISEAPSHFAGSNLRYVILPQAAKFRCRRPSAFSYRS